MAYVIALIVTLGLRKRKLLAVYRLFNSIDLFHIVPFMYKFSISDFPFGQVILTEPIDGRFLISKIVVLHIWIVYESLKVVLVNAVRVVSG